MKLSILEIEFRLAGCSSLKEKRHRLRGIRRLGAMENLLYFERGHQDRHDLSDWVFVAGASSETTVDQILNKTEDQLPSLVDAEIIKSTRGDVGL